MDLDPPQTSGRSSAEAPTVGSRLRVWLISISAAAVILFALDWLLGWIIWLPLYSGLFGFLVAGLIAGGVAFRMARSLRPVSRGPIIMTAIVIAVLNSSGALYWEYRHIVESVGNLDGFRKLRFRAPESGRTSDQVKRQVVDAFQRRLTDEYPPGGPLGYARWCFAIGEMELVIDDASDVVAVSHRNWAWLLRTLAGMLLTGLGLWFSFEGLRSPEPVRNTISPGEEYEEVD